MKNQKGFSLIELLIVVIIIGIIAAIAIPNLLAARRAANEASAIASLRTIHGAQATYQATKGNGLFGTLENLCGEGLIDKIIGNGGADCTLTQAAPSAGTTSTQTVKSGFTFNMTSAAPSPTDPAQFSAIAEPSQKTGVSKTGARRFGIGTEGVIYTEGGDATTMTQTGGELTEGSAKPLAQAN